MFPQTILNNAIFRCNQISEFRIVAETSGQKGEVWDMAVFVIRYLGYRDFEFRMKQAE